MNWLSFAFAVAVGLLTGIVSGCGIGGGSLLVLYLTAVVGTPQYAAGCINLLYFLVTAPTALIGHIRAKAVEWKAVLWAGMSGAITSAVAAWVAAGMDTSLLHRLFGVLLLYVGVRELFSKNENKKKT